ncbi:MAG: serine/threonine protein kinase [Symploca sp. SIO2E9]|nr:serine/threonine protein kinase [Symploca sp. SIO2E9]
MSNFSDLSGHGFSIVRELGHNRAGGRVTYLAINRAHHQPVVIKQFLFAKRDAHWSDYDAITREIQVLRGLNHPGIPCYLGSFETATGFCLVQEYKDAPSLVEPRSFEPDEIKQIAISLLNILIYLQNRIPPISHRDIKPENILADEKLNVFLVDFGLARIGNSAFAVSSIAKGTIGFMAPEQLFNRQLSEASDLYGLGATLICLLTGTPSTAISNLIDDDYRLNFKHLVPKLSLRWIEWLENMVAMKAKNRFPDAKTALAALEPIYVNRLPELKLSQSCLEFKAKKLGEKLTKTIRISNSVPDTILKTSWQVASHLSDPPHTPHFHAWINFDKSEFVSNNSLCKITVDTNKLIACGVYERQLLIHTNSQPEIQVLKVKVKTATLPIKTKRLPYLSIVLLILFATAASWMETTAWQGIVSKSGGMGVANAIFVSSFVAVLGLITAVTSGMLSQLITKLRTRFGFKIKALDTVTTVLFAGVAAMLVASFGAKFRAPDTALAAFAAVDAVVFMAAFEGEGVAQTCLQLGFSKTLALGVSLLSAALGISLGIAFKLGFLNLLVMSAVLGTGLLWIIMVLYPSLDRFRQIANYRQLEGHLIKP